MKSENKWLKGLGGNYHEKPNVMIVDVDTYQKKFVGRKNLRRINMLKTKNDYLDEFEEGLFSEFHDRVGICNVCGRTSCNHKETRLPISVHMSDVVVIIKAVKEKLEE